jgi:hypothetical protein
MIALREPYSRERRGGSAMRNVVAKLLRDVDPHENDIVSPADLAVGADNQGENQRQSG